MASMARCDDDRSGTHSACRASGVFVPPAHSIAVLPL